MEDADVEEKFGEMESGRGQDVDAGPAMSDANSPTKIAPEEDASKSDVSHLEKSAVPALTNFSTFQTTATEPAPQSEGAHKGRVIVMPDVAFVT